MKIVLKKADGTGQTQMARARGPATSASGGVGLESSLSSGIDYDFAPTGSFTHRVIEVGAERNRVLIVNNPFRDPASLVRYAKDHVQFAFGADGSYYPGVRGQAPEAYLRAFLRTLAVLMRETFEIPEWASFQPSAMYSLTTRRPQDLLPRQRIPHYDGAGRRMFSAVHYLFHGPLGGTSFYRHRATMFEAITEDREQSYEQIVAREIQETPPPDQYFTRSTELFEETFNVPGAYNSLVIFPGQLLHSGTINWGEGLSEDVEQGRLTLNAFFRLR
ncbi:MAG TPA: DUF6445 family protein [Croceibacterium sp.]